MIDTSRMGRQELIDALQKAEHALKIAIGERDSCREVRQELFDQLKRVKAERDSYNINLTSVQTRCAELLNTNRALDSLIKDLRLDESRLNWLEANPTLLAYVQNHVREDNLTVREAIEMLGAT